MVKPPPPSGSRRARLHEIIFEAETPFGKAFDLALLLAIVLSVVVVCLETVPGVRAVYGLPLRVAEWVFTILFTIVGKILASAVMILGYGIIAVPTGIVTVEIHGALKHSTRTEACMECGAEDHAVDAVFCKYCGTNR